MHINTNWVIDAPFTAIFRHDDFNLHCAQYADLAHAEIEAACSSDQEPHAAQRDWEMLTSNERAEIIDDMDTLNAAGTLGDHPFYPQWLQLRTGGYTGD